MRLVGLAVAAWVLASASPAWTAAADDAGALAACPTASSPGILTTGVAVLGTDSATADCHYRIAVTGPLANMRLRVNASFAGDHDLYVKYNATANVGPYFCSGASFGAAYEECHAPLNATGNYNIRVKRWTGASDFLVTAHVEIIPPTCGLGHGNHTLTGPVTANLTNDENAHCMFVYTPPAGTDFVRFTMTPASSDFDLYTRRAAAPTTTTYDCRPYYDGTATETCEHLVDGAAQYWVMVHRFEGSGAFTLTPESIPIDTIEPGDIIEATVAAGAWRYYKVVVPDRSPLGGATSRLVIALQGEETDAACSTLAAALPDACEGALPVPRANADLFVRWRHGLPSATLFDCASVGGGATGACVFGDDTNATLAPLALPVPQAGTREFLGPGRHFIGVRGVDGEAAFRLTAAWV